MKQISQHLLWPVLGTIVANILLSVTSAIIPSISLSTESVIYMVLIGITGGIAARIWFLCRDLKKDLSICNEALEKNNEIIEFLGVRKLHETASATIEIGLEEAKSSYHWLGASAFYVVLDGKRQVEYFPNKKSVSFEFVTLDPDSDDAISEQAKWEGENPDSLFKRIRKVHSNILDLQSDDIPIEVKVFKGPATFRMVIINDTKLYVSSYEKGKTGPPCRQLELEVDGLLGSWFCNYYQRIVRASEPPNNQNVVEGSNSGED